MPSYNFYQSLLDRNCQQIREIDKKITRYDYCTAAAISIAIAPDCVKTIDFKIWQDEFSFLDAKESINYCIKDMDSIDAINAVNIKDGFDSASIFNSTEIFTITTPGCVNIPPVLVNINNYGNRVKSNKKFADKTNLELIDANPEDEQLLSISLCYKSPNDEWAFCRVNISTEHINNMIAGRDSEVPTYEGVDIKEFTDKDKKTERDIVIFLVKFALCRNAGAGNLTKGAPKKLMTPRFHSQVKSWEVFSVDKLRQG